MRRNRVQEIWGTYRERVIPKDAPAVQITECRCAFFAGCESLLRIMMSAMEPGLEETPGDLQVMADIEAELKAFAEGVKAGRA